MIRFRKVVFVDTSAFIGLIANSDRFHDAAVEIMTELTRNESRLITSESVLFELANGFSRTRFRDSAVEFIRQIASNSDVKVIWSSRELFDMAVDLYKDRPDKEWSLTDCASFVVMKDHQIDLAFTSDKHFEQAGFKKLLEN